MLSETVMASNKDFVVKQAIQAAQTNKPAPVFKPSTSYVVKQAATGAYTTTKANQGKK
jgi:hypothetical protein